MLRRFIIIASLLVVEFTGYCLSDSAKISVLTFEPGNEIYTVFGHTAIRVKDENLNLDRIYNFGTFDFSSPFFYIKFLKGNLDYFLSVSDFNTFQYYSLLERRKIHEQVLDLSSDEINKIFSNLEDCYNSPARYYKYDFFYDNCATRVRDVIFGVKPAATDPDTGKYCCQTFRQLIKPYISVNYWLDFGINISLGREADKTASMSDFMFLPDYIMYILNDSRMVVSNKVLIDASSGNSGNIKISYLSPWLIVLLLALASIREKTQKISFYLVNATFGLTGFFLLFMSFFSENLAFRDNLNILWTLPALLVIVTKGKCIRKILQVAYIIVLLIMLLLPNLFSQELSNTFIPWFLLLIVVQLADIRRRPADLSAVIR